MKVKIIFFKVSGELIAYSRKAVIMQFKGYPAKAPE